jgi:hypothetical protein
MRTSSFNFAQIEGNGRKRLLGAAFTVPRNGASRCPTASPLLISIRVCGKLSVGARNAYSMGDLYPGLTEGDITRQVLSLSQFSVRAIPMQSNFRHGNIGLRPQAVAGENAQLDKRAMARKTRANEMKTAKHSAAKSFDEFNYRKPGESFGGRTQSDSAGKIWSRNKTRSRRIHRGHPEANSAASGEGRRVFNFSDDSGNENHRRSWCDHG